MDSTTLREYRKTRTEHPFMSADDALRWSKSSDAADGWTESRGVPNRYHRDVEGFTIRLVIETESIYPEADKGGHTTFGDYVQESHRYNDGDDWNGNWPRPAAMPEFQVTEPGLTTAGDRRRTISFPYTSIRFSGPGWTQGERPGYFIPSEMDDQFAYYRRNGASRAVAWDLTKAWVEQQISDLFSGPLLNLVVTVEAWREGVELASTSMGTDIIDNDEGRNYVFEMVDEHAMVDTVIDEARATIARLTKA